MTEEGGKAGWWWPLVRCPYCGVEPALRANAEEEVCAGCGRRYRLQGECLQWASGDQFDSPPIARRSVFSRLASLLNPLTSPLLPFRYLLGMRVEGYYRRTLNDVRLARKWRDHYLQGLRLPEDAAVLDFGCGRGRNVGLLKQLGCRVVGQDMRRHSWWARLTGCGFQTVSDTLRAPWGDASFDLVVEVEVVHYLTTEQLGQHVAEMTRVLKPGGHWVMLEANSKSSGSGGFRRQLGTMHELDAVRRICSDNGLQQRDLSYEAYYAPIIPVTVNVLRQLCAWPPFDLSDYDSIWERRLLPEQRGLWLLRLQKPDA